MADVWRVVTHHQQNTNNDGARRDGAGRGRTGRDGAESVVHGAVSPSLAVTVTPRRCLPHTDSHTSGYFLPSIGTLTSCSLPLPPVPPLFILLSPSPGHNLSFPQTLLRFLLLLLPLPLFGVPKDFTFHHSRFVYLRFDQNYFCFVGFRSSFCFGFVALLTILSGDLFLYLLLLYLPPNTAVYGSLF